MSTDAMSERIVQTIVSPEDFIFYEEHRHAEDAARLGDFGLLAELQLVGRRLGLVDDLWCRQSQSPEQLFDCMR